MPTTEILCATENCGTWISIPGRNRADADRQAKRAQAEGRLCPACYKRQQAAKSAATLEAAAARATEAGLPPLTGSDAQVAWATTIRDRCLADLGRAIAIVGLFPDDEDIDGPAPVVERADYIWLRDYLSGLSSAATEETVRARLRKPYVSTASSLAELLHAAQQAAPQATKASAWIDAETARYFGSGKIVSMVLLPIAIKPAPATVTPEEAAARLAAEAEAMLAPATPAPGALPVTVAVSGNTVTIKTDGRLTDAAYQAAKRLGYSSGTLILANETFGAPHDQAAEIATKLLAAGHPVIVHSPEIRASVIAGDYTPRTPRWVVMHEGKALLRWEYGAATIYAAATRLPGARYSSKLRGALVPATAFEAIADFAERYKFGVTKRAAAMLAEAAEVRAQALSVRPVVVKPETPSAERPDLDANIEHGPDASLVDGNE